MSHAQNTGQSLNLNSLSAGLITNANILNQPQPPQNQHHNISQQQQNQHQQQQSVRNYLFLIETYAIHTQCTR